MLFLEDKIAITDTERKYSDEGFLIVPARISRTGTQIYLAAEMGLTDREPDAPVVVYRPEEEVFSDVSLQSFANKPVTNDHPPELVNPSNSRKYSVGHAGPEVVKDGMFAKTVLYIIDQEAIDNIVSGKAELSNGYEADIDWTPGISPDGEQYDAVQRNIKGNHIAIVERGRAGPACRVADNLPNHEGATMSKITIDGVDYEVSDQAAQAVGKLQKQLTDVESNLEEKDEELKEKDEELKKKEDEVEEKDEEMEKKDEEHKAKMDSLKAKIPSPAAMDKLVSDRIALIQKASMVMPDLNWQGKDEQAIYREVVAAKCSGVQMDSASPEYLKARFDALVEDINADPQASLNDYFRQSIQPVNDNGDDRPADVIAREKLIADSKDAWKGGKK